MSGNVCLDYHCAHHEIHNFSTVHCAVGLEKSPFSSSHIWICVWLDWSSVSGRLLREMKGLSCVNYKIAGPGLTNCETQTKLRSTLTNVFMVDTKTQTKNRNLSGFEAAQKSFLSSTLSCTILSSWDLTKGFRSLSRPSTMVTRVRLDFVTIQNRILKLNF